MLCTKDPITSKIIIELDDKSHSHRLDKVEISLLDGNIAANAEIPIVHINVQYSYNKEVITKKLQEAYKTKYVIKEEEKRRLNHPLPGLL